MYRIIECRITISDFSLFSYTKKVSAVATAVANMLVRASFIFVLSDGRVRAVLIEM